jgi:DNA-binding beta-propeller fold protein YncE
MQETQLSLTITPSATFLNKSFENYLDKIRFKREEKAVVTTVAGDGAPGLANGPALRAKFKSPLDVAVANDGAVYVADGFNSCIRKIIADEVITFAGNGNANIKNGIGTDARFKIPCRLAIDHEGNLYLSDAADPRIRIITSEAIVSTYAGTNTFGFRDGDASVAQFGQSFGVIVDAQKNIFIADSQNDCIRQISIDKRVNTIAGAGSRGLLQNSVNAIKFFFLKGLVIDKNGNLFAADFNRIYKISLAGVGSTLAGAGIKKHSFRITDTIKHSQIEDLVMDEQENIYLSEAHRILKITPDGSLSIVAGGSPGYKDGDGESAKFNEPKGLGIDKQGNIYVADSNNNRIRKISFQ